MKFFNITRKLREAQHLSPGSTVELFHKNVNDIVDKLEEQEGLINAAKKLLLEAHKEKHWTTEVEPETELGDWLEAVEKL